MVEITGLQFVVQRDFPTLVLHLTSILLGSRTAIDRRDLRSQQDIGGLLVEVIQRDIQISIQKRCIGTHIEVGRLFPRQIGVTIRIAGTRHRCVVEDVGIVVHLINRLVRIVIHILITQHTV